MKLNKLVLTLTAAALLPTFAYAGTDEVVASFERDLNREATLVSSVIVTAEADPLDIVNSILNREPDAVVASFDRDLYRESATFAAATAREADPLDAINVAFQSELNNIMASFRRDLYRVPTTAPMVIANEADPLTIAINAVLWSEMVKPTMHVALVNGYRHTR